MMRKEKGSVTIVLALMMTMFLMFCLVLVEGVRVYFFRTNAMQAVDLAEFSVLSEFQKELFEQYEVFFLDLDYEQGTEQIGILEQRIRTYLEKNTEYVTTGSLFASNFKRATDAGGNVFFTQAVNAQKTDRGYGILKDLLGNEESVEVDSIDLQKLLKEQEEQAEAILEGLKSDEEGVGWNIDVELPDISFPSVDALTEEVFGGLEGISKKSIDINERIEKRTLIKGVGQKEKGLKGDQQLFHQYIMEHCNFYGASNENVWKDALEYQVEYMIAGEQSDIENLEDVMWRIFLLRSGGNYLFYKQDTEKQREARLKAKMVVGLLEEGVLLETVKEMFLIAMAIEEGISETKFIFAGGKVPLYQKGIFSGFLLGYESYLKLLLNVAGREKKILRCMDVIEMECRIQSGYKNLRMDHCVDGFELQWNYRFDRLFTKLPFSGGGIYESQITRKIYYGY